jgi:ArsR family transcriptional regulator, virulence genes transcriptional regulator
MYNQIFELHAGFLKSLSHPKRLEIIHLIRDQELPVGDIHTMLDLPQANISQHLMVLRDAGVVNSRREGKQIYYSLSNKDIITASDLLRSVLVDQCRDSDLVDELTLKMNDLVPLAHDVVCEMRLSPKTASFSHQYDGETYYFCASGCMKKFKKSPQEYVK